MLKWADTHLTGAHTPYLRPRTPWTRLRYSGVLTGTGLVVASILMGGSLMAFVNAQGGLIVAGGTFAAIAVALLTTFYGAVLANLMFIPMVTKLDRRISIEVVQIQVAIVGLLSMRQGDTTMILREKLKAFLQQHDGDLEEALSGK